MGLGIAGLAIALISVAKKAPERFAIPVDFAANTLEIPVGQNNLPHLLTALGAGSPEFMQQVREARDQLATGELITDELLLQGFRERHQQAADLLKPPLAFTLELPPSAALPLYFLFQGTAVVARQAMLENDYLLADRMIADMLQWSHLLRNAQPNEAQYLLARSGWQTAFDTLLMD